MPRRLEELLAVTVTHRDAPLEVIGRLEGLKGEAYNALGGSAEELVILATCNRFEVYAIPRSGFLEAVRRFLGSFWPYARVLHGLEAARHLFRVAAGLESAILGENEILGQVAEALEEARARRTVGKYLTLLFTQAVRTGKLVRSRTRISEGNVGAPGAAVKLASRLSGGLDGRVVLVIGAGEAATVMAKLLHSEHKPSRIIIVNRTVERARQLAGEVGGEGYGLDRLPELLREADVVLAAVTAGKPIVAREVLEEAVRSRGRLVIVDISNIPVVEQPLPEGVVYAGLADVQRVVEEVIEARRREVPKAERIVEEQLRIFRKLWLRRGADEALAEIMSYAERVAEEEVEELVSRLRGLGVDGAALLVARSFAQSLTKKLLRPLILYAHEAALRGELDKLNSIVEKFRAELRKKLQSKP
jgi:glutamyl-tRNA reductase